MINGDDAQGRIILHLYKYGRFAESSASTVDLDRIEHRVWITAHLALVSTMLINPWGKGSNTSPTTVSFLDGFATIVESKNNGVLSER